MPSLSATSARIRRSSPAATPAVDEDVFHFFLRPMVLSVDNPALPTTDSLFCQLLMLHHVTLGGTGKVGVDRLPKIGDGVLIGAGATVLGNVKIGDGAKIGAGSVVMIDMPAWTMAVGNPARLVGGNEQGNLDEDAPGETMDHTFIYVI